MKHCFLKVKQISTSTFLQKAFFLHYQGLYICPKAAYLIFLKIPLKRWFLWFMSPIFPSVGNQLSETWHPLSMHKAKQFTSLCAILQSHVQSRQGRNEVHKILSPQKKILPCRFWPVLFTGIFFKYKAKKKKINLLIASTLCVRYPRTEQMSLEEKRESC